MHPCCGPDGGSYIVGSEKTKKENPGERNIGGVDRKMIGSLDEPEKLLVNRLTGILLRGVGFLGFCPHQFWGKLGILYLGLVTGILTL